MKKTLCAAILAVSSLAAHAGDVGVSVQVGQPGFYGRIDIGNVAPPQVIYTSPVVIAPSPVVVAPAPVYMRVPPGHARHWAKHCAAYNACAQPVYFVTENWYQRAYSPYRVAGERRGPGDRDRDDHPGRGRGHGHGHGHDRD